MIVLGKNLSHMAGGDFPANGGMWLFRQVWRLTGSWPAAPPATDAGIV